MVVAMEVHSERIAIEIQATHSASHKKPCSRIEDCLVERVRCKKVGLFHMLYLLRQF